jgi:hypothetical protein
VRIVVLPADPGSQCVPGLDPAEVSPSSPRCRLVSSYRSGQPLIVSRPWDDPHHLALCLTDSLVEQVLDRVDQFADFDPRKHYTLILSASELTQIERNAWRQQAADPDDLNLDL